MKRYIKSSIEIPDNIYDIIDYVFEDYYKSDEEVPDFEELEDYYDIDENEYNQVVKFFNDLDKKFDNDEIKTYKEERWSDPYLQLSDRSVFLEFDDAENPIDDQRLYQIEDSYIKDFIDKYGVDISLQGRSGRHVCIPYTLDNLERYDELQSAWEEYEDRFIDKINSLNAENSQEEY